MPKYQFTAKDLKTGKPRSGILEANDDKALFYMLRSQGFVLLSHHEEKSSGGGGLGSITLFEGVSLKDKMLFARNLSIMISSGVQLPKAILTLKNQTKNVYFQKVLQEISESIQTGSPLGDALEKYPKVFDRLFVSMVRVGEAGGSLEEVLKIVAVQLEKEHNLVSKVRGAMMYPAVIMVAMIGVGILMLTYILPKITGVFEGMEVELPATTQAIIAVSDFLRQNAILVALGAFGSIIGLGMFARTESGRKSFSFLAIRTPIIKEIVIKTNSARFARIYSSLLRSGVSVVDSLAIIAQTLSNYYFQKAITDSVDAVQKGVALSVSIESAQVFPILVPQIVEVGESTGKTEEVLLKLAEFYEEDVDQMTKNMSSIIEPVLMIVIGGGVGFFAVAMLTPMYSVMENVK